MTRRLERWPALRAVLLTLVILHGILYGLQIPAFDQARLEREHWQPLVQRVQQLTGDSDADARDRIVRYSQTLRTAQSKAVWPLAWLYHWLDGGQTWNMFAGAEQQNFALHVDMRREGREEFETLYTVHDPSAQFERERIEYRRVHGAYIAFNHGTPGPYYPFCRWVAKRIFYTYPDAAEVRVRMRRLDYRDPEVRLANPERGVWANGNRISREQFEQDMRAMQALHE